MVASSFPFIQTQVHCAHLLTSVIQIFKAVREDWPLAVTADWRKGKEGNVSVLSWTAILIIVSSHKYCLAVVKLPVRKSSYLEKMDQNF